MGKMSDYRIETLETEEDWRRDRSAKYVEGDWYDDPNEVVGFVRWYYAETPKALVIEICDMFDRPWEWNVTWSKYQEEKANGK